ncbi:replication initiator [Pseudonocardia asaccharolytica]|uniref:replication initiator n=1 Tax=Pseudonocardia asaccharolytica TaxID=54010 RepID=UPI0027D96F94|nr:replication initiator [Pseudonocardia asaccharolytica]
MRPLALRRIDLTTGKVDVVPVPCGSTREDQCRPCADKARRLRMVQCREGWHLEHEPVPTPAAPSEAQKDLLAARVDLHAALHRRPTGRRRGGVRRDPGGRRGTGRRDPRRRYPRPAGPARSPPPR